MKYKILLNKEERKELKKVAYRISKYIKKKQIPAIVALDKAGRPAGLLILNTYKKIYPDERPPKIFFINPDSPEKGMPLKEKNILLSDYISKNPNEPLLILDEHCCTGKTIEKIEKDLRKEGAKKIYTSALSKQNYPLNIFGNSKITNFSWINPNMSGVFRMFGKSYPVQTEEHVEYAIQLRKELKQLANEIKGDNSSKDLESIVEMIFGILFSLTGIFYAIKLKTINFTGNFISNNLTRFNLNFFLSVILLGLGIFLFIKSFKKTK